MRWTNNSEQYGIMTKSLHWVIVICVLVMIVLGFATFFHGQAWAHVCHTIHLVFVWVLIALIVLHILGALKHQFVDKLKFINRMM